LRSFLRKEPFIDTESGGVCSTADQFSNLEIAQVKKRTLDLLGEGAEVLKS